MVTILSPLPHPTVTACPQHGGTGGDGPAGRDEGCLTGVKVT